MSENMDRVNYILGNDRYRNCYEQIRICEKDRIFCHHDIAHFCDVARLALIMSLKEEIPVSQELIYAAAMLHDIGRHEQYLKGIPHELASAEIAPEILKRCGFSDKETEEIIDAISNHRNKTIAGERTLRGLIYRADKMSRSCFGCAAENECDWSMEKKNMRIKY